MPRKHSRRSMKGSGFLDGITSSLSSLTNSMKNTTSSLGTSLKNSTSSWGNSLTSLGDKLKKSVPSVGSSVPITTPTTTGVSPVPSYTAPRGGKKRWGGSKKMRGGDFTDNTPTTGLAFHAAPFSGETARPNTIVGGKTRKRRKHHKRSKSHRRR